MDGNSSQGAALRPGKTFAATETSRGERRQLTIIRCDVVGSTDLEQRIGTERYIDLRDLWLRRCVEIAAAADADPVRFGGDEVAFALGRTVSNEDDPTRAVALAIALRDLSSTLPGADGPFAVRVSVATGEALVKDPAVPIQGEVSIGGPILNLSQRLLAHVAPGGVIVNELAWRHTLGHFDFRYLGEPYLDGFRHPARCWEVTGTRRTASADDGFLPLLERDEESVRLADLWQRALGSGQVAAVITGEAGTGKSRLMQWLEAHVSSHEQQSRVIKLQCRSRNRVQSGPVAGAFDAVRAWLQDACAGEDEASQMAALAGLLSLPEGGDDELLRILWPLIDAAPQPRDATVPPAELRERRLRALGELFLNVARAQPLLLLVEDLHWADPATLATLTQIAGSHTAEPLLMLMSCRSEAWSGGHLSPALAGFREGALPGIVELEVGPLSHNGAAALIRRLAGDNLPRRLVDAAIERSDGIPLFLEEIVQQQIDPWQASAPAMAAPDQVPAPLWESLMSRLDRIPLAKRPAQLAAVLGRTFEPQEVSRIFGIAPEDLDEALAVLLDAGIIELAEAGVRRMQFRHHLVRDVAYFSLMESERAALHRRAAEVLTAEPTRQAADWAAIATHFERWGELSADEMQRRDASHAAARAWVAAARESTDRSEIEESLGRLGHAAELLDHATGHGLTESTVDAARLEVLMEQAYATALFRGWAHRDVGAATEHGLTIAERIGFPEHTLDLFLLAGGHYIAAGNLSRTEALAWKCHALGDRSGSPNARERVLAHRSFAGVRFLKGDHQGALQAAAEIATPNQTGAAGADRRDLADAEVSLRIYEMLSLVCTGDLERADILGQAALARARHLNHGHSTAHASCFYAAALYYIDPERALIQAQDALSFASEHRFATFIGPSAMILQSCQSALGETVTHPLDAQVAPGMDAGVYLPWVLAMIGGELLRQGNHTAARGLLERATQVAADTGEVWYRPEIRRLNAMAACGGLAAQDALRVAQPQLEESLGEAVRQGAYLFALRTAVSLSRLAVGTGETTLAHQQLAPWIHHFAEARIFADLSEARAVFATLR